MVPIDLQGRTALATEASRGIGRAVAVRLAEAGARVVVHYRSDREGAQVAGDFDAATAGYRVGYDDASQFSREYKRFFGEPPIRDVERLRGSQTGRASRDLRNVLHGTRRATS